MQSNDTPIVKDLVLVGGGHSHVIVLRQFGMKPMAGVRLTVICRELDTPYSGMLPGFVAGHYGVDDIHIDLGPLCAFAGARLYHAEAVGLDLVERQVICNDRPPVPFDVLSVDIGSTPEMEGVEGVEEHATAVKPISSFVARWQTLLARVTTSQQPINIGVVGAGAGGTEMVLAMHHGLRSGIVAAGGDPDRLKFHLFAAGEAPLDTHPPAVRQTFVQVLGERAITLHKNFRVTNVDADKVYAASGASQAVDELVWATQAGAQSWLRESGMNVDEHGFIEVAATLESTSHKAVFAAGDCSAVVDYPREKAGVFAVRQGPPLARNLRHALTERAPVPFRPQTRYLSLISTGDKFAVASRGQQLRLGGEWVWRWKDWIDRKFMRKFAELPAMNAASIVEVESGLADEQAIAALASVAMRCGGCGAKVGASVLDRVMAQWLPAPREGVLVGLHEPDDAAVISVPAGKLLVQSVDSFRAMIDDPYTFGRVAANHSLGDVYAMGALPHTALAIATLPYGPQRKVEDTLRQVMAGALHELARANTTLVGGHTSEGAELSLGFSVNGLVDESALLRKGGMRVGDSLILTKALGTGVLFAANMRHKARARWISSALESMLQSNGPAAKTLLASGASACTDITGFGLLGHLVEMLKASNKGGQLDLTGIATLDGALETVACGITSSLQTENLRLRRSIQALERVGTHPKFPLLFDPQTAGGLLASIPAQSAPRCINQLRQQGYEAHVIGRVLEPPGTPEIVSLLT